MSQVRVCDNRCHGAADLRCRCWCGGVFHGHAGAEAREQYRSSVGEIPTSAGLFDLVSGYWWRRRVQEARAARDAHPKHYATGVG